jgi:glycosyltransferase involved in cell wall biosynthesis
MTRLVIDARLAGYSGIGTYLDQLLPRVLPPLAPWRPVVLASPDNHDELAASLGGHADVTVWRVPPLSVADLWSVPKAVGPLDLLWTPHFNVPLRSSCALAVTLHDLLPLTLPKLAGVGRSLPVRAWLRAMRKRARVVFCASHFTRGEALRLGPLRPDLVHVTPLGVTPEWFAGTPSASPARDPASAPTMIYVGLLKPHKNVFRLLRAFARVQDQIPHRLVLVARHRGMRNIDTAALALAARMQPRVQLVADLSLPELIGRVQSAQIAVQPSLHEGFGLPALEAMAAGTPVLASRAGAMPEVCGDAALYCDPESEDDIVRALLVLAGDSALRARLKAAGRERARTFSWDACAATTANALSATLDALRDSRP